MALKRGATAATPNAGTGAAQQAPLPFKSPFGTVKVYFVGTKTYKGQGGPKDKTVIHYDKNGSQFAFASNRADFVEDMAELAKLMTKPDGKQSPITATFTWTKGARLVVNVPNNGS